MSQFGTLCHENSCITFKVSLNYIKKARRIFSYNIKIPKGNYILKRHMRAASAAKDIQKSRIGLEYMEKYLIKDIKKIILLLR